MNQQQPSEIPAWVRSRWEEPAEVRVGAVRPSRVSGEFGCCLWECFDGLLKASSPELGAPLPPFPEATSEARIESWPSCTEPGSIQHTPEQGSIVVRAMCPPSIAGYS